MAQEHLITQEGYNALLEKLKELKKMQAENLVAIQDARGQGDLSENADYDAARNQQAKIAAEIAELEANIRNAKIIDADQVEEIVIDAREKSNRTENQTDRQNMQAIGA